MTPEEMARHPVVAAALAACGMTSEEVVDSPEWRRHDSVQFGVGAGRPGPVVDVSRTEALVRWDIGTDGMPRVSLSITRTADGWRTVARIARHGLPHTVVTSLAGRALSTLVDMPGAEGLSVVEAADTADGLVLQVSRPR